MGYGNGKCTLNFSKKRDQWENSGQTARVELNDETNEYTAYSYREKIVAYDKKLDCYIYNNHSFSNTTSGHQYTLKSFVQGKTSKNFISADLCSLNKGFNYNELVIGGHNLDIVSKYFPSKLKEFEKGIEDKIQAAKLSDKKDRLLKNLRAVNYKSAKNFIKALEDLKKLASRIHKTGCNIPDLEKARAMNISKNDFTTIFDMPGRYDRFLKTATREDFKNWAYYFPFDSETIETLEKQDLEGFKEYLAELKMTDLAG